MLVFCCQEYAAMTHQALASMEVVRRSMQVLECLNRRPLTTLRELHEDTGLPKPTLSRILDTLAALGYAKQVARGQGYRVTDGVLKLASGLRFIDHLVDAAIPFLREFTGTHGWPIYLAQIHGGAVRSRYTTSTESPLSFENTYYGQPMCAFDTAIGHVGLAYATAHERRAILLSLGKLGEDPRQHEHRLQQCEALFERVRELGYAVTPRMPRHKMVGIAVPLLHQSRSIAGLAMRFPRSVMSEQVAIDKFLLPLQSLAQHIVAQAVPALEQRSAARKTAE
jgi:IclR family mhp operon transcriptional activator